MAKNVGALAKPSASLRKTISRFHKETLDQIDINLATQQIWPTEVYPGYRKENEYRKKHGMWYSTGKGAKSFRGKILSADRIDNISIEYRYLNYMRFAEIGVGKGVSAEDVDRGKNVNYSTRYISMWNRRMGKSHRPSIRSEVNHLSTRIEKFLLDFYGEQLKAHVVYGFEMDINLEKALSSLGVW